MGTTARAVYRLPGGINSITFAALASAWACCPQEVQANTLPQPGRDAGSRMPHAAHVWLVPAGRTSRSSDPKLAGLLIQLLTAPAAVLLDAASFLASAAFIGRIRRREPPPPPARAGGGMRREIAEGLRYVLGHRLLRWTAATTATSNLFGAMTAAILVLYLVRHFGMSPGLIGLVMTVGNAGWLLGATGNARLSRRLGTGRTTVGGIVLCGLGALLVPAAPAGGPVPWLVAAEFLLSLGSTTYNIGQLSVRQAITPPSLHGRMNATMRFMVWGTLPLGSAIGGALGQAIGLRPTLWIAAVAGLLPVAPALASRIWSVRSVEEAVARFLPAPEPVQPEAPGPTPLAAGSHVS